MLQEAKAGRLPVDGRYGNGFSATVFAKLLKPLLDGRMLLPAHNANRRRY